MKQRAFALLALSVAVLSTACASYQDRVAYRTEQIPLIQLAALAGQSIAVDIRNGTDQPIIRHTTLHDDLEAALQRAGLKIDDRSSLVLRVRQHYLGAEFRSGRYQSCGHFEGQLLRDGKPVTEAFSSRACVEGTPNPWDSKESIVTSTNTVEANNRAYYLVLGEFLERFEQVAASLPRT